MVVSSRAERDLKKLGRHNPKDYARVMAAIRSLADDFRPPGPSNSRGARAPGVSGSAPTRLSIIDDGERVVTVLSVAHRKEVYLRR